MKSGNEICCDKILLIKALNLFIFVEKSFDTTLQYIVSRVNL